MYNTYIYTFISRMLINISLTPHIDIEMYLNINNTHTILIIGIGLPYFYAQQLLFLT